MSQDVYGQWLDAQKQWLNQLQGNQLGSQNEQWTKSYSNWLETQQNAWNQWQNSFSNLSNLDFSNTPFQNPLFTSMVPGLKEFDQLQKQSVDAWKKLQEQNPVQQYFQQLPNLNTLMQQMSNLTPSFSSTQLMDSDFVKAYQKMFNAQQLYNNFYRLYENFNEKLWQPGTKEATDFLEKLKAQQGDYYKTLVEPFIPEQVRSFLYGPTELLKNISSQVDGFWAPWKDTLNELVEKYVLSLSGDTSQLTEFYDLWQEQYSKTFGAYIQSPVFGNNAEVFEAQNQFLDTVVKLLVVSSEFNSKIHQITQSHVESKMKDYLELVEKNEHPKTYKDFYVYWSNSIEKTLNTYFYTDEFSELLGEFSEAYAKVKTHQDELLARYFANTPFVLEKDLQSVYKKLYDLRREVRAIKKELKGLNTATPEAPKPAKAPAAKKTTK